MIQGLVHGDNYGLWTVRLGENLLKIFLTGDRLK